MAPVLRLVQNFCETDYMPEKKVNPFQIWVNFLFDKMGFHFPFTFSLEATDFPFVVRTTGETEEGAVESCLPDTIASAVSFTFSSVSPVPAACADSDSIFVPVKTTHYKTMVLQISRIFSQNQVELLKQRSLSVEQRSGTNIK